MPCPLGLHGADDPNLLILDCVNVEREQVYDPRNAQDSN